MPDKMSALARSFPTLEEAEGLEPFDAIRFDRWISSAACQGSGALAAGRFILNLYNGHAPWMCGKFDFFDAIARWDAQHRSAFLQWALAPWWP
jgi:hypothetical protein